jgi:hypothetical protein
MRWMQAGIGKKLDSVSLTFFTYFSALLFGFVSHIIQSHLISFHFLLPARPFLTAHQARGGEEAKEK